MSIGLWTITGSGKVELIRFKKTEGASSLLMYGYSGTTPLKLERKYFACKSFRIDFQINCATHYDGSFNFLASEYGGFPVTYGMSQDYWERRRATFLWDKSTETKWYRLEKWNGSAWEQVIGDVGLGSEEPNNSTFSLTSLNKTGHNGHFIDAMTCEVLA